MKSLIDLLVDHSLVFFCKQGAHRSALVIIIFLVILTGLGSHVVYTRAKLLRPIVDLATKYKNQPVMLDYLSDIELNLLALHSQFNIQSRFWVNMDVATPEEIGILASQFAADVPAKMGSSSSQPRSQLTYILAEGAFIQLNSS